MSNPVGTILVSGSGVCAQQVAAQLAAADIPLLIASDSSNFWTEAHFTTDPTAPIEIVNHTRIHRIRPDVNGYRIELHQKGALRSRIVTGIVVADPQQRKANFSQNHLHPAMRVITLSQFNQDKNAVIGSPEQSSSPLTIVFLTGLFAESTPVIAAEVMQSALELQSQSDTNGDNIQTYVFTHNLKVAADGLEALYREAKAAGTVFIKFTHELPAIHQNGDFVHISFTDEITGLPFELMPDLTVVDETILPPLMGNDLAAVYRLEQDELGFVQADNVHRWPVSTNRQGICVAGSIRDKMSPGEEMTDAYNAALSLFGRTEMIPAETKAVIDKGHCIRCLTCHRLCPHGAIDLEIYPQVIPVACETCGICAAECPKHAIAIPGLTDSEITNRIVPPTNLQNGQSSETGQVRLVAFCCQRSAAQAAKLARLSGQDLNPMLSVIEVPCAGAISAEYIFTACLTGADGILLLTCHEGNCHSSQGNRLARNRATQIKERLADIGYDAARIETHTLASNMGTEFARLSNQFARKIAKLGPSPISSPALNRTTGNQNNGSIK